MIKVNNTLFSPERFHNGETIYKFPGAYFNEANIIEMLFEDDSDITKMLFAVQFLRDKAPEAKLVLKMLYIPYSRMDREIPEGNQIFSMNHISMAQKRETWQIEVRS